MSTVLERPGTPTPETGRRSIGLLVLAGALVLVVVTLTVLFGLERPPALSALADEPDPAPPAAVAWMAWENEESCIHVAQPTGPVATPWCSPEGAEIAGWTDDGDVLVRVWDGATRLRSVDPANGQVTGQHADTTDEPLGESAAVWTERDGDTLIVHDATTDAQVWRVRAPDRYRIETSAYAPGEDWLAMVDTAGRLLVAPSDGSVPPRVWASDVPPWPGVAWEGGGRTG
ncbi:hypothetical protein [Egicoccus sp. AB-alg2]|uniref:hypothetical protein n=1 Tax=Egicoccus sp. AB-alg2 TaxID=3242693 RepID=UPI00359F103B